ncbi:MAG TPA: MFS transporter, partial [Burkholderiaceae bacterium]|nr:MFS transporter [Burkholderiaceae bacterium]
MPAPVAHVESSSAAATGSHAALPRVPRRALVAATLGNGLEFYDFLAYGAFAVYIGKAFFPSSTPYGSLL